MKETKENNLEQLALNTVDVAGLAKYTLGEKEKTYSEKQIYRVCRYFYNFFF